MWFVTRASRVFRSQDKGMTWDAFVVPISGTGTSPGLSSIAFENGSNGITVTYQPNRAARTTDGGESWTEIPVPSSTRLAAIEHIPGTMDTYLTNDGFSEFSQMALTKDGGANWEIVLHPPSMDCMQFISPAVGYGGGAINILSNTGLYRWEGDLSDSIATGLDEVIREDDLVVIGPNPFTDHLVLLMDEKLVGDPVSVDVFSITGQSFYHNGFTARQKLDVRVPDLPTGIYVLKLNVGDKIISHRILRE